MKPALAGVAMGAVLIVACGTKPNPYARIGVPLVHGEPDLSGVQITLERSMCHGTCPVYTLTLEGTGRITYRGESYVMTKGERTGAMDPAVIRSLLDKFESMDFMHFEHACDWGLTDMPLPTVRLRVGGQEHSFTELTGGTFFPDSDAHSVAHRDAVELMAAIDGACRVEQWIGSHEDRWQNRAAYR